MTDTETLRKLVSVKPLEWEDCGEDVFEAVGFNTVYRIAFRPETGARWQGRRMGPWSIVESLDAAKDAAQADYEARILAALTPSPEAPVEGAPEWHLSKLLSYIVTDPKQLRGLHDDDALHMEVRLRVGDVRNAYQVVLQSFGSDGTEEARWIADTENACPACGGSGHKDDTHPPAPQPEAPAAQAEPVGWFEFDENTGEYCGSWCSVKPADGKGFRPLYAHPPASQPEATAAQDQLAQLVEKAADIFRNCAITDGVCCCGDNMDNHAEPMNCGHSPVDHGSYVADLWMKEYAALSAGRKEGV